MNEVLNEDLVSLDSRDLMQADLYELVKGETECIPSLSRRASTTTLIPDDPLLAALSETRSVISQITLINGEKIWMRDEINNNAIQPSSSSLSVTDHEVGHQSRYSGRLHLIHGSNEDDLLDSDTVDIREFFAKDDDGDGDDIDDDDDEDGGGRDDDIVDDEVDGNEDVDDGNEDEDDEEREENTESSTSLLRNALTGKTTSNTSSMTNTTDLRRALLSSLEPISPESLPPTQKLDKASVENILLLSCTMNSTESDPSFSHHNHHHHQQQQHHHQQQQQQQQQQHQQQQQQQQQQEDVISLVLDNNRRRRYVRRPDSARKETRLLHHCHICSKGFKDRYSVNVHVRTHTGEKPFACALCGKRFRQKAHLAKHHQTHASKGIVQDAFVHT